ncbi:MAG TPA: hypothetical protein P5307_14825 [Pirellulaceae bacterium]|nr:hypothetical protein [Planctomycetales bacterium]MCB9940451.1 hypothetical protein [Planctomycetaceae bacterium]HRX80342.1 hypothetical protein [Pirellulaceae bacterium]
MLRRLILLLATLLSAASCGKPPESHIHVWHGKVQQVGNLGIAQDDFNLLGEVSHSDSLVSLKYQINDDDWQALEFAKDSPGFRRLAAKGHFNADIPVERLRDGVNHISVQATDRYGRVSNEQVTINKLTGSYLLPAVIQWSKVTDPQSVGQIVDGHWGLTDDGLRTVQPAYDRVFVIGEQKWQDYEVTVDVTIHDVTTTTSDVSGGNGLGVIMRFAGHVNGGHRNFPTAQPKWGYQPFGAIGWLRWEQGKSELAPQKQFYAGYADHQLDFGKFPIQLDATYRMKLRCETLEELPQQASQLDNSTTVQENATDRRNNNRTVDQGITRYCFKIWRANHEVPSQWDWQVVQISTHALRRGGLALVAHHVDVSFGDVRVTPLTSQTTAESRAVELEPGDANSNSVLEFEGDAR